MRHPSVPAAAILAATAAIAAGCGGSSASYSSATSTTQSAAATPSTTPAAATATVVATKHDKLGTILAAGKKKLTVYMFEGDHGSSSSCSGACAGVWPPVTTSSSPSAAGTAVAADLGTVKRADGKTQVTYKGHPLYYFARDKDNGDAYGEGVVGFGASWYVLKPTGEKIDKS